jgi:hypothetical protein
VAHGYRRRPPVGALAGAMSGQWCSWLRCAHCGVNTVHAIIFDALADAWRHDGCDRERYDRTADRDRRRIRRRLNALAAEGVTIVRAHSTDDMTVDNALVEVIEYAYIPRFLLRVFTTATPSRVLEAVELAEDALDDPTRLGPWADDSQGLWRGVAIVDVAG